MLPRIVSPVTRAGLTAGLLVALCGLQAWFVTRAEREEIDIPLVRSRQALAPAIQRCAACHPRECEDFANAPHQRTLVRGSDPKVLSRFAGRSQELTPGGQTVSFEDRDGELWMASDGYPEAARVDWMFGSGQHAMTPISLLTNAKGQTELIEGSVSWYPPDVLSATPGADLTGKPGIHSLGEPHNHATTLECFGCHVTHLPMMNGVIDESRIMTGVTCERCHPGGEQHARAQEGGQSFHLEKWSALTPLESVNRCGECHRRADQLTADELNPERTVLVRFASVGFVMSPCFQGQDESHGKTAAMRYDCLTCHNPHRPAEKAPGVYVEKCQACHGGAKPAARHCSASPADSNCLPCHMPPVEVAPHLKLTDHWVRVRRSANVSE